MRAEADSCDAFLQWALPRMQLRWPGYLRVRKRACKRITRRLRELHLPDFGSYRDYLHHHEDEWQLLDELCRIVVSRVYRDPQAFDRIRDVVLPRLANAARTHGRTTVQAWSVGCACGEEPWTLRVLWDLDLGPRFGDLELRILATDADQRVLDRAERATYPRSSLRQAPASWRGGAFRARDREYALADNHRHGVVFRRQDLRTQMPDGPFDLILCRNLAFTYFDDILQRTVAAGLRARLRDGGELIVGAKEQLPR